MAAPASEQEIHDVNRRYHDVAADSYDAKWGISFGETGRAQVLGKVEKVLGPRPGPFADALEIGAGTGYFSLNLMQEGVIGAATCTDISAGMLATLERNAAELGLPVRTECCDAADLPFADGSFDLVVSSLSLHHWDRPAEAGRELARVVRPGGRICIYDLPAAPFGDVVGDREPERTQLSIRIPFMPALVRVVVPAA
jgi:ubiquinone/menaquinone biosynthesis C-methylase UbiE